MGKFKAKKVATPGSLPSKRGRPKKKEIEKDRARSQYKQKYSEETLEEAMRLLKSKKMSLREASKQFSIPKATLVTK